MELRVFCIASVERNNAFAVIKLADLIVNFFNIIAFVSEEITLCNGQEAMGFGKDFQGDSGISNFSIGCYL